jgi:hypothetical protein
MTDEDPDKLRGTVVALRAKFDLVSKLMRDLELEMASLSPGVRLARMPEFDARAIALTKDRSDVEAAAKAFLHPSGYPKGNA